MNKKYEGIDLNNFSTDEAVAYFSKYVKKVPGWKVLVLMYTSSNTTPGGIKIPPSMQKDKEFSGCTGLVIGMGKDAYTDKTRYSEPWCQVKDWVLFGRNAGLKSHCDEAPLFTLDEDRIELVIDDPRPFTQ